MLTLPNKMHELQISVQEYSLYIIILMEVKQKFARDLFAESVVRLEGYEIFHNLDSDREGRGICFFHQKGLKSSNNDHLS